SPQSLVADARRHGVVVHSPDVNESDWNATLESMLLGLESGVSAPDPRPKSEFAVRLGVSSVRTIGDDVAKAIAAGRPYASMEEVVRAASLTEPQVEALATAGAFGSLGLERR